MSSGSVRLELIVFLLFAFVSIGCAGYQPTSPTSAALSPVQQAWSPYVGVHPYGVGASQKPYLLTMIRTGMLKGVRMGGLDVPGVQQLAAWLSSQGVEVLGLIDNKQYLRDSGFNEIFSQYVQQNPSVRVWEIGNEVEGPVDGPMSPQEYVQIFKTLFYYAKMNHPQVRLAPQSDGLSEMLDAGLDQVIRDGLSIVTIHYYNDVPSRSLTDLEQPISRIPRTTEVWMTETGDNRWATQISYVETNYPRYRELIRANRIFWYVLSECRSGDWVDFSLVRGLPDTCAEPPLPSPLFSALTNCRASAGWDHTFSIPFPLTCSVT